MPLKIEIRHPLWLVRAITGAAVAVLGVILLRSYSEGLGLALTLTGIVIGVRGTFGPIFTALICLLYLFVTVTYFYWMVPEKYDYGFDEWFSRNWWMYAWSGVLVFGILASTYRRNSDTWKALRTSYSAGPEKFGDKDEYPSRNGLLRIDEELVEVHEFPAKTVYLLRRKMRGISSFRGADYGRLEYRMPNPILPTLKLIARI